MSNLAEVLSVEEIPGISDGIEPFEMPEIKETISNPTNRVPDLEADYSYARDNLHFQQQLLRYAALKAFENASLSDSPRQMEVFATLLSQMTNNTKQLMDVHKQMKDITTENVTTNSENPAITGDNPTIFIGSPTDVLAAKGAQLDVRLQRERVVNEHNQA